MVTIRKVAKECGYSPATVSAVLNNSSVARNIPTRTKKHIRRIANELGYLPNVLARSLRSHRSRTVGIVVPDITDPYCTQVLRGMEKCLYRHSYLSVFADIQNDRPRFSRYIEMLLERRVDGLIMVANSLCIETDLLYAFEQRKIPCVVIGRKPEHNSISSVVIKNAIGTKSAIRHLFKLGHRRIAFIKGPPKIIDSSPRWQGVCDFVRETKLKINAQLIVQLDNPASSSVGGYEATRLLLGRKCPFTAIMAFDDMTAFGAIRALSDAGYTVPGDCSVVGFDDVAAAAFYKPSLTTVHQPLESFGSMGAEVLLKAINSSICKKTFGITHLEVAPKFIVRESTAPPKLSG